MHVYIVSTAAPNSVGAYNHSFTVMITDDIPVVKTVESTRNDTTYQYKQYVFTYKDGKTYYLRNNVQAGYSKTYEAFSCESSISKSSSFSTYTLSMPTALGINVAYYVGPADGETPVPPTQWPDDPVAPSPPELPEPGTNPTVEPTPWQPIIDLPDFSFDLNVTTAPDNDEVIDWLKKIYYELRNFHTDARGWFAEISDGFEDVVQAINTASSQLYSQLLVIDDHLRNEFQQTRTYLYNLFHWLAKQIDFQNDPYNDSNVVYWLKQIWSKLGGGINTRPTDPTTEPEDWWDWLIRAIQNFLIGLGASANDLISEIADIASQVMHEFPFSIPWDIAAILAALTAAPITPAFTVTIPTIDGWWQQFDIVVDLKPFDAAAETIRLMEKLLFTGFLIWKSKDLLDFMDITRWFD